MRVCERKKCYPVLLLLLDSWVLWIKSISFSIWSVPVHSSRGVFSGYIGELIFLFEYIRWDDSTKLIVWAYVKELKYTLVTCVRKLRSTSQRSGLCIINCGLSFRSSFAEDFIDIDWSISENLEFGITTGIFSENRSKLSPSRNHPHSVTLNEEIDHSNGVLLLSWKSRTL